MDRPDLLLLGAPLASVHAALADMFTLHGPVDHPRDCTSAGHVTMMAVSGARRVDAAALELMPAVRLIANFGVGYDNIDIKAAAAGGIVVTNTPDVLTEEVADLTVGLLLATVRQLPQADRFVRAGQWSLRPFHFTTSLRTRRIGIVGLGRIGEAVARRLTAFGRPIVYHGRRRQPRIPFRYYPRLVDMAEDVDTLISVLPGGEQTHHLIDAHVLEALGPDGIVINVGRGSVIDEAALIDALQRGVIRGAGLDVFAREPHVPDALRALDQVVLLPHVGSATHDTRRAMGDVQVANLLNWAAGKGPVTAVAETPWATSAATRET